MELNEYDYNQLNHIVGILYLEHYDYSAKELKIIIEKIKKE